MNTKKTKNKNKPKPVSLLQDNDNVSETIGKIDVDYEKLRSVKNEDCKEQNCTKVENNHLMNDTPKKPKRTKVKIKKDTVLDDNKHEEVLKPPKHQEMEETGNTYFEETTQELPVACKKKNKNKKISQPFFDEDTLSPLEISEDKLGKVIIDPNVNMISKNIEIIEKEEKEPTTQKKKKKKKNRQDPEKSDKTETQSSCTFAFQKLLQSSDICNEEISDSETISKITVDDLCKTTEIDSKIPGPLLEYEDTQVKEIIKFDSSKTKGKNKKGKKKPFTESTEMENKELFESTVIQDNIVVQDDTNFKEESPKPRALIAKPVEKKRKAQRNLQESNNENVSSSLIKADESLKIEKVNIKDDNIVESHIETENLTFEQDKEVKRIEEPIHKSSTESHNAEQPETDIKADCSDFVKVKTAKNKKKKNKNIENHPINEIATSNLDTLSTTDNPNVLSEQKMPCNVETGEICNNIIAPDFIDYPRSVSEMIIDNNNNTIIQEITTPEEIKLGIPIFTTVPMVQGSGESPEAQINNENIDTKVTEIDLNITDSPIEKTDIKSKMIEVNRDMEVLRRSIERSLAGLTNVDKSDSNTEKDFDEIFKMSQSQSQDSQSIEENIVKPGTESLSVATVEVNIEDKKENEKCIISKNNEMHILPSKDDIQTISETKDELQKKSIDEQTFMPICPIRKDKGKGKSKKKGKQDIANTSTTSVRATESTTSKANAASSQESTKEDKSNQKAGSSQEKSKKQASESNDNSKCDTEDRINNLNLDLSFEPIENFEDALTSSVDDVNKTFELIANETNEKQITFLYENNPEINIIAPAEEIEEEEKQKEAERRKSKQTPVSQPKNLLGHTNIPVQSNKVDYKKEKNKAPNDIQAKVKIKDSMNIEKKSKELAKVSEKRKVDVQDNIQKYGVPSKNTNQAFVYKYNFRKVFLQSLCNLCKTDIIHRTPCQYCLVVFYCSPKHKDEDWSQHQPLCFAVSTIAHLKDQKHIYANAKNITGQEYRVLRMQVILSCERILKRKLVPWEQEAMLYPRICADFGCREWKQKKLTDCQGCGQISYCTDHPEHLPSTHQRWCKPYALYKKLVMYHQASGKLEPKMPTRIMEHYQMTDNINEVLGSMYEEKIDISDIQYATLTQIASAPLTTLYSFQLFTRKKLSPTTNGITKKSTFTIHSIGNELQYEADSLNKWETFFLHLSMDVKELRVVFIDPDLNQSNLPLDLLGNIKSCENCRTNKRRVIFNFEDKKNYNEYYSSDEFIVPNIVCAFNPNIQRSSIYNNKEDWTSSMKCILKQKIPFLITSHTLEELKQDLGYIKSISRKDFDVITEPRYNPFASVRPDRNFITDHEMPLIFKNYSFSILCGA